jgi:chloramphenicol-sensitive protein RarD
MKNREYKIGMICAFASAVTWGFLPIYWQALRPIDSIVIIFYRIVFVALVTFLASLKIYGMEGIKAPLRPKGNKMKFFLAGLLITVNWSIYIAAVNADFVIQTVIGYYIEPLMVSVFGLLIFKEKLNRYKTIALFLAGLGVLIIIGYYKQVPMIALSLAITFAVYTAVKKSYRLEAILSLFYETMFLLPVAIIVIVYFEFNGVGAIGVGSPFQLFLLSLIGFCTAIPLVLFTMAANRISMVNLGIIEYISPSITLILGIFLFKEPFDLVQFICFVIIWIGLVFFTYGEVLEQKQKVQPSKLFRDFPGHDRRKFPDKIKRVTAGAGGEALLVFGSEKTALIDCGMPYCADQLIQNIKDNLAGTSRSLDIIFLTHTHYDHIGALPKVLQEWPEATVYGASYCRRVFQSERAKETMAELSRAAWERYTGEAPEEMSMDGLRLDQTLSDYQQVSLGDEYMVAIETKGHTDCSLTYVLEPDGIMFASESTGVLESQDFMHIPIVKSYKDSMEALEKCRSYPIRYLISPHFGVIPEFFIPGYWNMFQEFAEDKKEFLRKLFEKGSSEDEIMEKYVEKYWNDARNEEQPKEAFMENARNIVKAILREFRSEG